MENIEGDESRRDGAGTGAPVLCPARQKLITDNIRLAYHAANNVRRPKHLAYEEWESECLWVLVKSARFYDFGMGFAFSTYFYKSLFRYRRNLRVHACAEMRDIRRTQALPGLRNDGAILPAREEPQKWIEDEDNLRRIENLRNQIEIGSKLRIVFEARLQGKTFAEIAREFGCTKQNVEALWRRLARMLGATNVRKTLTRKFKLFQLSPGGLKDERKQPID